MFRWILVALNRWYFCFKEGHIIDYNKAEPVRSLEGKLLAWSVRCMACKKEFYVIIEQGDIH